MTLDSDQAAAFEQLAAYYASVFRDGRKEYAIPRGALTDTAKQKQLGAFFWWAAWAAGTNRPGSSVTYTNNWPHEPLIANNPTPGAVLWSIISIVCLIACIGALVLWYTSQEKIAITGPYPERDPFLGVQPTPSQRATIKYFLVVVALWGVQILMGAVDGALRSRRTGILRLPARQVSSVRDHAHLASATRDFLDRHIMAGDRPLRRACCQWP